ncbi:hypothetical protein Hanom_Chr06g00520091 [Helianthus anomalus]
MFFVCFHIRNLRHIFPPTIYVPVIMMFCSFFMTFFFSSQNRTIHHIVMFCSFFMMFFFSSQNRTVQRIFPPHVYNSITVQCWSLVSMFYSSIRRFVLIITATHRSKCLQFV